MNTHTQTQLHHPVVYSFYLPIIYHFWQVPFISLPIVLSLPRCVVTSLYHRLQLSILSASSQLLPALLPPPSLLLFFWSLHTLSLSLTLFLLLSLLSFNWLPWGSGNCLLIKHTLIVDRHTIILLWQSKWKDVHTQTHTHTYIIYFEPKATAAFWGCLPSLAT